MSKLSLVTSPVREVEEVIDYKFDKKTGWVTMPSGKTFNPILNQNCDELSLDELRIYNIERGLTGNERRLPEHKSPEYVWGSPAEDTELELLAEAALAAQKREKDATLEAKSATAAFREALEKAGKLKADNKNIGIVRTVIYPTKRFDEETARGLMTKKLQKECEKTVLDTAKVKANVSPADYEKMQVTSGMTLKLSLDTEQA